MPRHEEGPETKIKKTDAVAAAVGVAAMTIFLAVVFGGGNSSGNGSPAVGTPSPESAKPSVVQTVPATTRHSLGKVACGEGTSSLRVVTPSILKSLVDAAHSSPTDFAREWNSYARSPVPCNVSGWGGRYTDDAQHALENQLLESLDSMYPNAMPGVVYEGTVGAFELDAE